MHNIEITNREIIISVVIVLLLIGLGFFIATSIHDKVQQESEQYFKALKVNNNPELFDYAIRTEVGNMLSYGKFEANEPVSNKLIKGKYFSIIKTEEHYTMHTRTETYKCGESTCTRTETYWTWDYYGDETSSTKTFNYLGRKFNLDTVRFNNYDYIDTVQTSSHVRFIFEAVPVKFNGSLFSKAKGKTIKNNKLHADKTIKEVIENKKNAADKAVLIFWVLWVAFIIIVVILFVALENRYINNQ